MYRTVLFSLALIAPLLSFAAKAPAKALTTATLGDGRTYLIALPDGVIAPPLIVALHGGGGSPQQFARNSGLTEPALAAGYAIAYPAGTSRRGFGLRVWNAGYCCGYAPAAGVDDVGFLDRVIADAGRRFGVDTGRVYMTGMSNGAIMTQLYAARRPGRLRAIASVSGTLDAAHDRPDAPVPILHIHGTADDHVPYAGGQGESSLTRTDFTSVADDIAAFLRPFGGHLTRTDERRGGHVERTIWRDGKGTPEVELVTIDGGGHVWPGGNRTKARDEQDVSATDEAIRFFNLHP